MDAIILTSDFRSPIKIAIMATVATAATAKVPLNIDLMMLILRYLDPIDLAKMASVSLGWKTFVYRDKVWAPFTRREACCYKP